MAHGVFSTLYSNNLTIICDTDLNAKGVQLENELDSEDASEYHVQIVKHVRVHSALPVKLFHNISAKTPNRIIIESSYNYTGPDLHSLSLRESNGAYLGSIRTEDKWRPHIFCNARTLNVINSWL